jgi:hypothetical protein
MEQYKDNRFSLHLENGILMLEIYQEFIDYKTIDDAIKLRLEKFYNNEDCLLFADCRKIKSLTREARERLASKDGGVGVKAVAMLINSKVQRIIFNFFHSIYKAPAKAKLFTDKKKALDWLEKQQ